MKLTQHDINFVFGQNAEIGKMEQSRSSIPNQLIMTTALNFWHTGKLKTRKTRHVYEYFVKPRYEDMQICRHEVYVDMQ